MKKKTARTILLMDIICINNEAVQEARFVPAEVETARGGQGEVIKIKNHC